MRIGFANDWHFVSAAGNHTLAMKKDGSLWVWGPGWGDRPNRILEPMPIGPTGGSTNDWQRVIAGQAHTVALKKDGSLWTWGWNGGGQLGDGTVARQEAPLQMGSANDWQQVTTQYGHTVALKHDGSLWAWGANGYGQLGDGTNGNEYEPVQIGNGTDWGQLAAGGFHTVALKTDGSLWTWGHNAVGQVGDGTMEDRLEPVRIGSANATDWTQVAAGDQHTVGMKRDGSLWTWGSNESGQLGDGTLTNRLEPMQVGSTNDWQQVAADKNHTVALKSDGSLWAWGGNGYGQLGDGTMDDRLEPVRIGIANDWQQVSVGDRHTVALKTDGSLWAWGGNDYGQLGNGTVDGHLEPRRIGLGNDWQLVTSGGSHSLALKSDGSLWAWGSNSAGEGGINVSIIQFSSRNDWAIDADKDTTFAIAPIESYTVTLEVQGGDGTVHVNDGESISVAQMTKSYPYGTQLNFSASDRPPGGLYFVRWSGDGDSDSNGLYVTVRSNLALIAEFEPFRSLSLSIRGDGQIKVSPSKTYFKNGEQITLTARPSEGWSFVNWSGDLSSNANRVTVTVQDDVSLIADFDIIDQDTPYEAWLKRDFSEAERADLAISGPAADPDGDDQANLIEYLFGTPPKNRTQSVGLALSVGSRLQVSANIAQVDGIRYWLEVSADLATWASVAQTPVSAPLGLGKERLTWTLKVPTDGRRWHARLSVELDE